MVSDNHSNFFKKAATGSHDNQLMSEKPQRKSLYDQLQESKDRKQLEYQQLLESQNSSYKLDEKSARHYKNLQVIDQENRNTARLEEAGELERFRKLKQDRNNVVPSLKNTTHIHGKVNKLKNSSKSSRTKLEKYSKEDVKQIATKMPTHFSKEQTLQESSEIRPSGLATTTLLTEYSSSDDDRTQ